MMPTAYGLFAAAGCVTAVLWLARHRAGMGVSENEFWAAMWALLVGALLGAKALFVALGWEHYARGDLRFWADFQVGFVFFGGLAGAVLAGAAFAALRGLDFVRGADYFAVALPLGHAIGRVGCYFAGCCSGRGGHPVQLDEAFGLLLIALACRRMLVGVERGTRLRGDAFRLYLVLYGGLRFALDPLRADGRPERLLGISHQQGIALLAVVLALLWQRQVRRVYRVGSAVRDEMGDEKTGDEKTGDERRETGDGRLETGDGIGDRGSLPSPVSRLPSPVSRPR